MKTNWRSITIFYIIACLWSWPFFWWRDIYPESWQRLPLPNYLKIWLIMWGPGIAALIICAFKVKQFKMFSIFGTSIWRSCLIFFLPFIAISVLNQQPKLFFLCGFALTSTLGEELGWRFFLQNTLTVKSRILKYIIIGSLWEFWHFTTRTHVGNLNQIMIRLLIFYSLLIFMSFLIGEAYNKTKSILVAVTLHLSFNLALSEEISKGQVAVAIVVPLYLLIILFWPKENI